MKLWFLAAMISIVFALSAVQVAGAACFGDCGPRKPRWAGEGYVHRFWPGPYGDYCTALVNVDVADGEEGYSIGPFEVPC